MEYFPAVDPIPLPAPVWLFKLLHTVTLALHFGAVYFLIGGLACATWWSLRGRLSNNPVLLNASGSVVHRLPVVMGFLINLGIPPLLFTQVLYGRALYTSSVLIGAWWIGVIAMVIVSYYLLYRMAYKFETGQPSAWMGLVAMVLVLMVGHTYSANMTLMLRPAAWQPMYAQDPLGATLPTGDPTTLLRWAFMMVGGLGMGGVGLAWLGVHSNVDAKAAGLLRRAGGRCLAVFTAGQLALGIAVYGAQPEGVQAGLGANMIYTSAGIGWGALSAVLVLLGVIAVARCGERSFVWPSLMAAVMLLNLLCIVTVRDGIRDITLRLAGYEVWDRVVVANWSTIIVFLVLFVAAGGMLAWLGYVVYGAKGERERYA
jgi:hypothetical protein